MFKLGASIGRKLRDELSHIQWIDLTMNDFSSEPNTNLAILQGLKKQKDLQYAGLTTMYQQSEFMVQLVSPNKKTSISLNMRNSELTDNAMFYLCNCLANP